MHVSPYLLSHLLCPQASTRVAVNLAVRHEGRSSAKPAQLPPGESVEFQEPPINPISVGIMQVRVVHTPPRHVDVIYGLVRLGAPGRLEVAVDHAAEERLACKFDA